MPLSSTSSGLPVGRSLLNLYTRRHPGEYAPRLLYRTPRRSSLLRWRYGGSTGGVHVARDFFGRWIRASGGILRPDAARQRPKAVPHRSANTCLSRPARSCEHGARGLLGLAYLVRDFWHLSLSFISQSLAFIAMRYDMSHPGSQACIATR